MASFEVVDEGDGLIRATVSANIVRRPLAGALCRDIEHAAARHAEPRLAMDLGALSKATPAAGFYAMRQMKRLDPDAIALFRGNRFMRGFARLVMRLARFKDFELFADEASARRWLSDRHTTRAPEG
jgi:hypothetical protein